MITIEKGDSKLIVTRGQFENEFKKLGYHEVYETFDKKEVTEKNVTSLKIGKNINKDNEEVKTKNKEDKEKEELDQKFGFSNKTIKNKKTK